VVKTNDSGNYDANPYIQKGNTAYMIRHSPDNEMNLPSVAVQLITQQFFLWIVYLTVSGTIWPELLMEVTLSCTLTAVLKDTVDYAGTISTNFNWLGIGTNSVAAERYNGVLDEVRIYNRALDPNEIGYLATNGTGVLRLRRQRTYTTLLLI